MLDLRLVTPPASEAVALDIARQHVRVGHTQEDVLLVGFIAAATQAVEDATGRALLPQTWEYRPSVARGCSFMASYTLPHAPVLAVDEVATLAADDTATVLGAGTYRVSLPSGPTCGRGEVRVGAYGEALRIRYRAGYTGPNPLPAALHSAILLLVGSLYENREAESERSGSAARMLAGNPAYERLLAPYRLIG